MTVGEDGNEGGSSPTHPSPLMYSVDHPRVHRLRQSSFSVYRQYEAISGRSRPSNPVGGIVMRDGGWAYVLILRLGHI